MILRGLGETPRERALQRDLSRLEYLHGIYEFSLAEHLLLRSLITKRKARLTQTIGEWKIDYMPWRDGDKVIFHAMLSSMYKSDAGSLSHRDSGHTEYAVLWHHPESIPKGVKAAALRTLLALHRAGFTNLP